MIEELKDENLIRKAGGRFRLTSLIQKRLAHLNRGAVPFAEDPTGKEDKLQIVVREILEDKISLDLNGELEINSQGKAGTGDAFSFEALLSSDNGASGWSSSSI
ncbi:MAG: DNA-directed RNA polymerase subunit omega [Planctomycetia bacterium]|nr:DNA-directed RNA polymerase subunit omega [Planctomycetia bacterium]